MFPQSRVVVHSLWISSLLLAGCPLEEPALPGTAAGMIGPAGGTISTSDYRLMLTVPKGALRTDTPLRIEAVNDQAPGQLGQAFKISPAGVHFDVPAAVKLALDEDSAERVSSNLLHVASKRDEEWIWYPTHQVADDDEAEAEISETGIFSLVPGAQLLPGEAKVKLATGLTLEIMRCSAEPPEAPDADPVVLGYKCEKGGLSALFAKDWSVNGVKGGSVSTGTIAPNGSGSSKNGTAQFLAPFAKPAQNPVAVSVVVELADEDDFTLTSTLIAQVEIVDDDPKPSKELADVQVWNMHYDVDSNCDHSWQVLGGVNYERNERHAERGDLQLRRTSTDRNGVISLEGRGTVASSFQKSTLQASQYFSKSRYDRGDGASEVLINVTIDPKRGAYDVYFQHGDFTVQYGGVDIAADGDRNEYGPLDEALSIISAPILATGELTRTLPSGSLIIEGNYDFAQYWADRQNMEPDFDLEETLRHTGGCPSGKTSWILKPAD